LVSQPDLGSASEYLLKRNCIRNTGFEKRRRFVGGKTSRRTGQKKREDGKDEEAK